MTPEPTSPGAGAGAARRRRLLDPVDRVAEIVFGLIMALTFTGALSVASERAEVSEALVGAIGCNIAWGLVDAVMFLATNLVERGRGLRALRAIRGAPSNEIAHARIAESLPPMAAAALTPAELEPMRQRLVALETLPKPSLRLEHWLGALAVFLWVVVATFPVVIPFLLIADLHRALRVSNLVAVAMLFACGWTLGRIAGRPPWLAAIGFALVGAALVGATIALGG